MSGRYLTDLADVLVDAGLAIVEYGDWRHRARGSGGYGNGLPTHVMVHHSASQTSPQNDVAYIADNADAAPLSNLYLARDGVVWVIAAGATNTNGSGHDWWGGGVPDDSMNTYAIGIEAGNNGVGEVWPDIQQRAYVTMCRALCDHYGIAYDRVRSHFEWTSRKIDCAGPSRWASGTDSWRMDGFRADVGDTPTTPAPTPQEDDDMPFLIRNNVSGEIDLVYGDGKATALDLNAANAFADKFGEWVDLDPPVFDDFARKGVA